LTNSERDENKTRVETDSFLVILVRLLIILRKTQSDELIEESCIEADAQAWEKVVKIDVDIVRILNE